MIATLANDHGAMELLLANGAEVDLPNVFQITPLMAAVGMSGTPRGGVGGSGNTGGGRGGAAGGAGGDPVIRTMNLLLDAGADINAQVLDSHTNTAWQDSYIPGADNEGRTALHAAVLSGRVRVVEHLIARGADATIRDAEGKAPLDLAQGLNAEAGTGGRGGGGPAGPQRSVADVLLDAAPSRSVGN
jgi:ankyrin repeat protein